MSTELAKVSTVSVPVAIAPAALPALVEQAGAAAQFACDEFVHAEHHNPHTQKAGIAVPGVGRT